MGRNKAIYHASCGISGFRKKVYDTVQRVPKGRVTTYGLLARAIKCGSAQAVGQALRRNPFAPQVPCHRVIGSDLRIGGFEGRTEGKSVRRKIRLLAVEGVYFRDGELVDKSRIFRFSS